METATATTPVEHLCLLANPHLGPEHELGRPHRTEIDGVVWSYVTDAYHMLALRGVDILGYVEPDRLHFYTQPDHTRSPHRWVVNQLTNQPSGVPANLLALRKFAGPPKWGFDLNELALKLEQDLGRLGLALVDRTRLARLLDGLPGETVTVWAPGEFDLIRIDGPDWIAAIMPCKPPRPIVPEFKLTVHDPE